METIIFFVLMVICNNVAAQDYLNKWSFDPNSPIGPQHWAKTYPKCGGSSQAPIDIKTADVVYNPKLKDIRGASFLKKANQFNYTISNYGAAFYVTLTGQDTSKIPIYIVHGDSAYRFSSLHFHWGSDSKKGSEHTIDGKEYPLELHLVLLNVDESATTDRMLIWAQLFEVKDTRNAKLDSIVNNLLKAKKVGQTDNIPAFLLEDLLIDQAAEKYYMYYGSFTTPPCSEIVKYLVSSKISHVNEVQLEEFRKLLASADEKTSMSDNYRPPQPINGRTVQSNFDLNESSSGSVSSIASFFNMVMALAVGFSFMMKM
ncbi:carbonic anhydrase 1-like [Clytia hemisphaerica]|uniref:Carbonic anhydrase n=1 Tax=Clytia hemisphaerica TaxID=252671 RepID=A0A7M5UZ09_9CNID|eukprot:TCONS_00019531-protein